MADFPGNVYAPPGVYVETTTDPQMPTVPGGTLVPVLIGTGNETLTKNDVELIRGSSASNDLQIFKEDETGRAVASEVGSIVLGSFDGVRTKFQVRNYPVVSGDNSRTVTTDRTKVTVTVDGTEVVVRSLTGATGLVELAAAPALGSLVRCTYYFDRSDLEQQDDVSAQVTTTNAEIFASIGGPYTISAAATNNSFTVTSDRATAKTYTVPDGTYTTATLATYLNTNAPGTLVVSAVKNEQGLDTLKFVSGESILIGSGSMNAVVGLASGQTTSRNKAFRVFNGPVCTGTGGGVTSTSVADVVVTVDSTVVTPVSLDGANRLITLGFAPSAGSTVLATYFWNTWQDTYDNLPDVGVTSINSCGDAPGISTYIVDQSFVLSDDKILWGTAQAVEADTTQDGTEAFDATQITATLIDNRSYMDLCTAVSGTSGKVWTIPNQPTTGNGRDTPLGQTLYGNVSNGRLDLPTDRPDLINIYWGFSVDDAEARGAVTVLSVDSTTSRVTLRDSVPEGAQVYSTYWYNRLVDGDNVLTSTLDGISGIGTYTAKNPSGVDLYGAVFGVKGTALSDVTIVTPSGSEYTPDVRLESMSGADFTGPVDETVTVQFAATSKTAAEFSSLGIAPYVTVENASDRFGVKIDGVTLDAAGIDLSDPIASGQGFFAVQTGDKVVYDNTSGSDSYVVNTTNDTLVVSLDDVEVSAQAEASATATAANYVSALNRNTKGDQGTLQAGASATSVTLAASASAIDDYYVGWELSITSGARAGETRAVTAYVGSTQVATTAAFTGATGGATYSISDPTTRPKYVAETKFDGAVSIAAGKRDELKFRYVGATTGASGTLTAVIDGTAAVSISTLVTELNDGVAGIAAQVATLVAFHGLKIWVTANSTNQLVFHLRKSGLDASGYIEFITGAEPKDFAVLAGIDTAASAGVQTKLVDGSVARLTTIASTGGETLYDRLVIRNRILPGRGTVPTQQGSIVVKAGNGNTQAGLSDTMSTLGGIHSGVKPAQLGSTVGFSLGQDTTEHMPMVTFYSTSVTQAKNHIFKVTVDGTSYTTTFSAGAGTDTPLGPVTQAASVLGQIVAQNAALSGLVGLNGAGIFVKSGLTSAASSVVIGNGTANTTLGFTMGDSAGRTLVAAEVLASALMNHSHTSLANAIAWGAPSATRFAGKAVCRMEADADGAQSLHIQSLTSGAASAILFFDAATSNAFAQGTVLGITAGDSASGQAGISGFFVKSSDPTNGSGSINSSRLNPSDDGTGQDGVVGQTYRDVVTGLTFTILARAGNAAYPTGSNATFTFKVGKSITTNANRPVNLIPGLELTVANTFGVTAGNTAKVRCFERGGEEPAVGDTYYVSYTYTKDDFGIKTFSDLAKLEAEYGEVSPQNTLSLAGYLALLNGATVVALKQVPTTNGVALESDYIAAIDGLAGVQENGLQPGILVPLFPVSTAFLQYVQKHCDVQSSKRYRSERTAICGFGAGVTPGAVQSTAQALSSSRMRIVYPDSLKLPLQDRLGRTREYLVDGYFAAAALAGSVVSPSVDVATPWDNRILRGFSGVGRILDAVTMNQIASSGVTVLAQQSGAVRVRHGLTTDVTNILTKIPTVQLIADEVQIRLRATLDPFIGIKLLPGVMGQVEGALTKVLQTMVSEQKLAGLKGVVANISATDPTVIEVEASYAPIFPLQYINVKLSLRAQV